MAIVGMNPDVVEKMGRDMQALANEIKTKIVPRIDKFVNQIPSVWRGTDAERFKGWWVNQHRKHLLQEAEHLHGLGQSALNNAAEQREASGSMGSTVGASAYYRGDFSDDAIGVAKPVGGDLYSFSTRVAGDLYNPFGIVIGAGTVIGGVAGAGVGYWELITGNPDGQYMVDAGIETEMDGIRTILDSFIEIPGSGVDIGLAASDYFFGTDTSDWISPTHWGEEALERGLEWVVL